ncbi:hypothetical protein CIHG_00391 [Coccidioides immitis H538.4]|uniref:Uncharacterized protein n=1 Tax=Coccidioides immitis H538.4 TaxID=396776 RepID=A0A0J8RBM1_COCIT|nr:hypothetical protein CIHG_00391 [Coccidioides immitis H538.4]
MQGLLQETGTIFKHAPVSDLRSTEIGLIGQLVAFNATCNPLLHQMTYRAVSGNDWVITNLGIDAHECARKMETRRQQFLQVPFSGWSRACLTIIVDTWEADFSWRDCSTNPNTRQPIRILRYRMDRLTICWDIDERTEFGTYV